MQQCMQWCLTDGKVHLVMFVYASQLALLLASPSELGIEAMHACLLAAMPPCYMSKHVILAARLARA